ncbi:histone-lysine N-methyltransferase SETMAR [Trichonephila clavipes]|nr:histone-lysine N-methyltransferase SETMAR [Trichonephila clavipes]
MGISVISLLKEDETDQAIEEPDEIMHINRDSESKYDKSDRHEAKGKNAVQARKKMTDVYGEGVLTVRQCQNWFAKFRSGNFDVEDAPRSGRPDNTTINSEVYCHQLDKLNDAVQQKRSELINRKGVVFHQDNARPHTSLVTRQKLLQLEWDTMPHPPYSPDLAPSDYYLFRSLQNFLDAGVLFPPGVPGAIKNPPCRKTDTEYNYRGQVGILLKNGVPTQPVSSSLHDHGSKFRNPSPIALEKLLSASINQALL